MRKMRGGANINDYVYDKESGKLMGQIKKENKTNTNYLVEPADPTQNKVLFQISKTKENISWFANPTINQSKGFILSLSVSSKYLDADSEA